MKIILKTILLFVSFNIYAQQPQSVEQILQQEDAFWQTSTALVKQGINAQNGFPYLASGINYSRITPFTNLYQYNEPDHNTADARLFEQALSELYRASNKTKFVNNATYKQIKNSSASNRPDIQIGIINTDFDFLNYNEENESLGGLRLVNGVYQPIAGKPSAYTKHVTLIAPLSTTVTTGGTLTIGVNPQLFFNLDKKIDQINLDFGSGLVPIVKNQVATNPIVPSLLFKNGDLTIPLYVTYTDGATLTTYIKINVIVPNITRRVATDCTIKTDVITYNSKIPYQAWTEATPRYGKLEYKIFYANSNQTGICGIDRVKKPFVVIDGFDPGDKRKIELIDCDGICQQINKDVLTDSFIPIKYKSIYRLMSYKINPTDPNEIPIEIVPLLQQKGFDVIVLNLPADRNPSDYEEVVHDYGADFIERNAMTFASFLRDLNASLKTRGITEKAVVVGPSMGGQITRYALAYMEKQQQATGDATWNHNTRLWVSMDSPHQGANVPLSIQGSTYFLGFVRGKEDAKTTYNEKLMAPATREMLLEHCEEAIKQLFTNPPSPYFTNYHTNLDSNGLPNSKGYPMNLRKIAITNGSLSGKQEASPGQTVLDMRGYIDFSIKILGVRIGWNINLFRSTQNYQYPYGGGGQIYSVAASGLSLSPWLSQTISRSTSKSLGSLDVVSGGLANSVNDFKESSIAGLNNIFWGLRLRKDMRIPSAENIDVAPHAFIPTHSALDTKGFANWHQPINLNLVCTKQTPFDSYFGEAVNRDHIFFTKESITWLLKELGDSTTLPSWQAPSFPVSGDVLIGSSKACLNANVSYQIADICQVPSEATWAVTPNLQLVSTSAYALTVKVLSYGEATITGTFKNGQTFAKTITLSPFSDKPLPIPNGDIIIGDWSCGQDTPIPISFEPNPPFDNGIVSYSPRIMGHPSKPRNFNFTVTYSNPCNGTSSKRIYNLSTPVPCATARLSGAVSNTIFKIFPNPSSNNINISLFDETLKPSPQAQITAKLYDLNSLEKRSVSVTNNTATVNVSTLPKGIYVLKINIDGVIESHQVVVE
jgi:pimeloyl-ACP methyl ester carboxylesterase